MFILEGFDYLKFDLELQTNSCSDWRKRMLPQIFLSSLLQKIMFPEFSLLLELGHPSKPKIYLLLQYPRNIIVRGFTNLIIKSYCAFLFCICVILMQY